MKNPFLIGEKIYLSPLTKEDITDEYISWLNDAETSQGNSHATFPNTYNKTLSYVESTEKSNSAVVFAIRWKKNDLHIGNVSLQNINWINRSGDIAMLLGDKKYRGKGVGTEVMRLMITYGFDTLNLNRITGGNPVQYPGGRRICEKNEMKKEGLLREVLFKNGEYLDAFIFSILRSDYEKNKKKNTQV